ncbi:hypothetical protein CDAR_368141 [Caerostris darwini]|uniref:Uncharacterized protein n=1 Tax=Caerostris darwini TaxID=1538125 RepID=A0AAV4UI99_9ARAC|nr:hypothetical protein CDAR_368141 [Caerostris darwini]
MRSLQHLLWRTFSEIGQIRAIDSKALSFGMGAMDRSSLCPKMEWFNAGEWKRVFLWYILSNIEFATNMVLMANDLGLKSQEFENDSNNIDRFPIVAIYKHCSFKCWFIRLNILCKINHQQ